MSSSEDPRERHERLQRLFLEARSLDVAERADFLEEACAGDAGLRAELDELLAHDRPATSSDIPSGSVVGEELDALHDLGSARRAPPPPESLGEYRILRKLGEGGMGTVYEARQDKLQRTVALKVLRPGSFSPQSLRRFEHEGEFLGRLEHPGIARIYDAGRADTPYGPQPYFAMELVEGVPLTEYARRRRLTIPERIELVSRVADAVQHAHRQGVIHRDLKPDNILVDETGQPKILDFGIARAVDSDVQLTTMGTDVGQILGTLAYMSPEQATGDPKAIDARSDVYSLGVLLHELVADRLPYDVARRTLPEALRIIQEEEPPRLSTSNTQLRGDVETIVQTALDKDKTRRYASAGSLADDLRHYLRDEPITARPASRIYTLRKFVRRNKTVVVAALLVFSALTTGLVVSLRFALGEAARLEEREQLSALLDVETLVARADDPELWPPHPELLEAYDDWIEDAEALLAQRADFEASRARLRARALTPRSGDLADDARQHPSFDELQRLEQLAGRLETQLRTIRDGEPPVVPDPDSIEGDDPSVLLARAFEAFQSRDPARGQDELGLATAQKARSLASADLLADAELLVAWGHYYLGQDEPARMALEAARAAFDDAPIERRFRLFPEPREPERLTPFQARNLEVGPVQLLAAQLEQRMGPRAQPDWISNKERQLEDTRKQVAELKAAVEARRTWRYADGDDAWWSDQFDELLAGLDGLERDLLAEDASSAARGWSVRKRRRFAEELQRAFAPGGEHERRWAELLPAMRADYPGPDFGPQMGLVPLGRDPQSERWEFAHLASGAVPEREEATGRLILTDDTGIVLVLLPGGEYLMGAQSQDPEAAQFIDIPAMEATETRPATLAAKALDDSESPPRRVLLTPFFLAKHETTQGQWERLTGTNPARDKKEGMFVKMSEAGIADPAQHPVNMVSWDECVQTCERFGLRLPTSAEWEYGARAGTGTAWWTGDDPLELQAAANLADRFGLERGALFWAPVVEDWSDGEAIDARVDLYAPNPFGLHNVHGNLSEWCQDANWSHALRLSAFLVDPVVHPTADQGPFMQESRVTRGGSFADIATLARSAKLMMRTRGAYEEFVGVRAARSLDPR